MLFDPSRRMRARMVTVATIAVGLVSPAYGAESDSLALVVKGGLSLGAYQAGVSFALIKAKRFQRQYKTVEKTAPSWFKPPFDTATGASAGNVNTILATLSDCELEEGRVALFSNLFFDTWVNIGWDTLFPSDDDKPNDRYIRRYRDHIGSSDYVKTALALSRGAQLPCTREPDSREGAAIRRAYNPMLAEVCARLKEKRYRKGCNVDIAITVTHTKSTRIRPGFDVRRMNFMAPMTFSTSSCQQEPCALSTTRLAANLQQCLDSRFIVSTSPGKTMSGKEVTDIALASSAFPIAFAPIPLNDPDDQFIDGGFFDNIPIGRALELQKARFQRNAGGCRDEDGAGPLSPRSKDRLKLNQIVFVNPELVRRPTAPADTRTPSRTGGLAAVIGKLVDEARNYELQGLARFRTEDLGLYDGSANDASKSRLHMTSRYFELYGDAYLAFGAFFHRDLRITDYLTGVYDGLRALTTTSTGSEKDPDKFVNDFASLADLVVPKVWDEIYPDLSPRRFIDFLRDRELAEVQRVRGHDACEAIGLKRSAPEPGPLLHCYSPDDDLKSWQRSELPRTLALHLALQPLAGEQDVDSLEKKCGTRDESEVCFDAAVPRIIDRLKKTAVGSELGAVTWVEFQHAAIRDIVRRLLENELDDDQGAADAGLESAHRQAGISATKVFGAIEPAVALLLAKRSGPYFGSKLVTESPGGFWSKSFLLLPQTFAWDMTYGGPLLEWELGIQSDSGVVVPVGLGLTVRREDELDRRTAARVRAGLGFAPGSLFLQRIEANAIWEPNFEGDTGPVGADLSFETLGILRISGGYRDLIVPRPGIERTDSIYLMLGITNIPGIWLGVSRYMFGGPL